MGLLSAGMTFVQGETSLFVIRFLLGAAEAGFFPGMILYLTYWFPASTRAKITGAFPRRNSVIERSWCSSFQRNF